MWIQMWNFVKYNRFFSRIFTMLSLFIIFFGKPLGFLILPIDRYYADMK